MKFILPSYKTIKLQNFESSSTNGHNKKIMVRALALKKVGI